MNKCWHHTWPLKKRTYLVYLWTDKKQMMRSHCVSLYVHWVAEVNPSQVNYELYFQNNFEYFLNHYNT